MKELNYDWEMLTLELISGDILKGIMMQKKV